MRYICQFMKDLPEDVIKKERKKIISTRKPGKEIEAYLSDPELGNLEVTNIMKVKKSHFLTSKYISDEQ